MSFSVKQERSHYIRGSLGQKLPLLLPAGRNILIHFLHNEAVSEIFGTLRDKLLIRRVFAKKNVSLTFRESVTHWPRVALGWPLSPLPAA